MSISGISGSSSTSYMYDNSASKNQNSNDPMATAISALQATDPTLAAKMQKISDDAVAQKKAGASEKDIRASVDKAISGLSTTEKTELQKAMPQRPGGHHHGGHGGPPPSQDADSTSSTDSSSSSTFDLKSYLGSLSSTQNDTIVSFLQKLASAAGSASSTSSTTTSTATQAQTLAQALEA